MSIKIPFEAKLLIVACMALILLGCGSGESTSSTSDTTLSNEEADIAEYPIVYITRPTETGITNLVDLDAFNPDAQLYLRAAASPSSPEINITRMIFGDDARYDVRDINISYDGTLMVFAARGPYDEDAAANDEEQPSVWNLYEYNLVTGEVYPIMNEAQAALGHDITPHYLADGRIIFSSSRQHRTGTIMLDEGKPQYSYRVEDGRSIDDGPGFALHVAEFDSNRNLIFMEQVTFNRAHDFDPVLLDNGKVVFARWDRAGGRDQVSFYQMNPDGAELEILFGYRSHETEFEDVEIQFSNPQVLPDGQLLALLRTFDGEGYLPNIVKIDIENFVDTGVSINGTSGSGVTVATDFQTTTDPNVIPPGGRFSYIAPLEDGTNRAIVSWSFCRLLNSDGSVRSCNNVDLTEDGLVEAPPNYGLWLFDFDNDTQVPLILNSHPSETFTEIIIAQPRDIPVSIPDVVIDVADSSDLSCDPGLFSEDTDYGLVHIRSVYDLDGSFNTSWAPADVTSIAQIADPVNITADERLPRFVRFEKPVYFPDPDLKDVGGFGSAFGPFMREVLGYAPVQPDGSVKAKVPADVPFMLTIVDQYGRRLNGSSDHNNWLQVRPGEVLECNGCHSVDSTSPHGRRDARPASINDGAISSTMFPNTNPSAYQVDISVNGDGSQFATCLPNAGETMADVFVRTDTGRANLSADIVFEDLWTDPMQRTPDETYTLRYSEVQSVYDAGQTNGDEATGVLPFNKGSCADEWNAFCRVVINYETHIQPLWEVTRNVTTDTGPTTYRCIDCHSNVNPTDGSPQVPAGQLSLTGEMDNNRLASYRDLVANNFALIDDGMGNGIEANGLSARDADNNVIPELEKQPDGTYCYRWEDGRLINATIVNETVTVTDPDTGEEVQQEVLDDDGHPIPLSFSIRESNLGLNARLSRGGARASNQFRSLFEPGFTYSYFDCGLNQNVSMGAPDFDHSAEGLMSEAELKMIWEWLDIGSAYYNNPFDVPD